MSGGTRDPRLLVATVAVGGASALGVLSALSPWPTSRAVIARALLLVVVTAVAELVVIPLRHGTSEEMLTLFEVATVANIVLLPPGYAALVCVVGQTLAQIRERREARKVVFNFGSYTLGVVPALALYHWVGGGAFSSTAGLLSLLGGMAVFTAVNLLAISTIIATHSARPLRVVLEEETGISLAMGIGNSAVGMVAVSLYLSRPALLPAVLAPALALHLAFRGWVKEKELSTRMEEEKTKLGRVLEHSSEGIVLADASGSVVLWSPAMERITGVPVAEAVGKAVSYLLRGHGRFGHAVVVDVSGDGEPVELEIVAADGGLRWIRVQHGPGYDEQGSLSFDVLVVADVTRQREVDRLKDDFISTVSHELRTPLTPIKGYASLLLHRGDQLEAERRVGALQAILERADHMGRLVEDLLLASKIGDGDRRMPEVNRQPVDVGHVCEKALRPFRSAHPHREFRLSAPDQVVASSDPLRVEQVVANLVSNAVKFSDDGAPVDVSVSREGGETVIRVRDEGRGIPPDRHEEIFEKFKRLEDPLRMETGGAGLGLYIVRQLSQAMGGRVAVESEPLKGSTFTVTLPATGSAAPSNPMRREGDVGERSPEDERPDLIDRAG